MLFISNFPEIGFNKPIIKSNKVLLPVPVSPIMPMRSPDLIEKLISLISPY